MTKPHLFRRHQADAGTMDTPPIVSITVIQTHYEYCWMGKWLFASLDIYLTLLSIAPAGAPLATIV